MKHESKDHEEYHKNRQEFKEPSHFILSLLGYSAGYGSVWRFPYCNLFFHIIKKVLFSNGGGAFLIPYLICFCLIALPLFYFELSLGQVSKIGIPQAYERIHPKYKGFGYISAITCFNWTGYYNLLLAFSYYFFFASFIYPVPWTPKGDSDPWSKDYFYNDIINISDSIYELGSIQWTLFACYVISQVGVYFCIKGGVELSGKVAIYTATGPYILFAILLVRGLFLDGAMIGLSYLFSPNLSKIFDLNVWVSAASQVFYQMSLGQGIVPLYGSYRQRNENLLSVAILIPLLVLACGLMAAIVVFSYIGYISKLANVNLNDIPLQGPELAFVLYPACLTQMPFTNLLAMLFFLTMILLGIDSQFGLIDGVCGAIEDAYLGKFEIFGKILDIGSLRLILCVGITSFGFLYCTQAGFYYLAFVDKFVTTIPLFICVLLELYLFTQPDQFEVYLKLVKTTGQKVPRIIKFLVSKVNLYMVLALLIIGLIDAFSYLQHLSLGLIILGILLASYSSLFALYLYIKHYNDDPKSHPFLNEIEMNMLGSY